MWPRRGDCKLCPQTAFYQGRGRCVGFFSPLLTHRRPSLTESIISSAALSTRASSNRRYTWLSKECMLSTLTMQPACRDGMEHIPRGSVHRGWCAFRNLASYHSPTPLLYMPFHFVCDVVLDSARDLRRRITHRVYHDRDR